MNNALASLVSSALTMTSLQIAALTGKEVSNIHRDIRNMLADLDDSVLKDVLETKDSRGYTASFSLPKDLTLTLVSGYSAPMRHKIVCRWLELEAQTQAPAKPLTYREAMMLAVERYEQLEAAKEQLAIAAPKVLISSVHSHE